MKKEKNNKNNVTVTAPTSIAENRNILFVNLFRMRQYFMFLIIHIFTHPQLFLKLVAYLANLESCLEVSIILFTSVPIGRTINI
jgi:hypothetical protein